MTRTLFFFSLQKQRDDVISEAHQGFDNPFEILFKGRHFVSILFVLLLLGGGAWLTPAAAQTPDAPTDLTATRGNAQVKLSWTAPSSTITGYEYRQSTDGGGVWLDWIDISGSSADTIEYLVEGLTNDTEYTFQVRAVNGTVKGTESSPVMATPKAIPDAPTDLKLYGGEMRVMLRWTKPSDGGPPINRYEYRQKNGQRGDSSIPWGSWLMITTSNAETTEYIVEGLTNDNTYSFDVRAVNDAGGSTPLMGTTTAGLPTVTSVTVLNTDGSPGQGLHGGNSLYVKAREELDKGTSNVLNSFGYSTLMEGQDVYFYRLEEQIFIYVKFSRKIDFNIQPQVTLRFSSLLEDNLDQDSEVANDITPPTDVTDEGDTLTFAYKFKIGNNDFAGGWELVGMTLDTKSDNKANLRRFAAGSGRQLGFAERNTDSRFIDSAKDKFHVAFDSLNDIPPNENYNVLRKKFMDIQPDDRKYNYLVDVTSANVRLTGLITDTTHDDKDFLKGEYAVNFHDTHPMSDVAVSETQRYLFDVEIRFFNYGIGINHDRVIADDTQGFEAGDIEITGKAGAVVIDSEWDVAPPEYIGMDHRDPGIYRGRDGDPRDGAALVTPSAAFKVYKATITPPSGFEGSVEIKVRNQATEDIAKNQSKESNALIVPINTVNPPSPRISRPVFPDDAPDSYDVEDNIEVEVTFAIDNVRYHKDSEDEDPQNAPYVPLYLGSRDEENRREATWDSEEDVDSTKVTFSYEVKAGDDTSEVIIGDRLILPVNSIIYSAIETSREDYFYYRSTGEPIEFPFFSGRQVEANPSAVAMDRVIFNELRNAREDKNDWLELKNISDEDVSLKAWQISLVTGQSDEAVVAFPDYTLPPGGILLIVNTDPGATDLARGENISAAASKGGGVATQYFVAPSLKLPDTPYLLLLRSALDKTGQPEAFEDVLGTYFRAELAYATQVWPLRETTQPENAAVLTPDEAWQRVVVDNKPTRGYLSDAWGASGYQAGLGYDAKASERSSLGTPGYPNEALVRQSGAGQISISEVMFSAEGGPHSLPQWIELYNNSSTEAVNLAGWELEVALRTAEGSPRTGGFTFETLHVLPNQTVLLVTYNGRHSGHFPDARVYNLATRHGAELALNTQRNALLSADGFSLKLSDTDGTLIDAVGNLGSDSAPAWNLPSGKTADGHRISLRRQYEKGTRTPRDGMMRASWVSGAGAASSVRTYWGHPQDVGTPGYRSGGPLPVALSAFLPRRTADAVVIKWATQSELDNAGFNLLRSESKTGVFKVINPTLIRGAGTSGERHLYQYTDKTAKPGVVYYYQLEEVSFAGVRATLRTARLRGEVSAGDKLTVIWGDLKKQD